MLGGIQDLVRLIIRETSILKYLPTKIAFCALFALPVGLNFGAPDIVSVVRYWLVVALRSSTDIFSVFRSACTKLNEPCSEE